MITTITPYFYENKLQCSRQERNNLDRTLDYYVGFWNHTCCIYLYSRQNNEWRINTTFFWLCWGVHICINTDRYRDTVNKCTADTHLMVTHFINGVKLIKNAVQPTFFQTHFSLHQLSIMTSNSIQIILFSSYVMWGILCISVIWMRSLITRGIKLPIVH